MDPLLSVAGESLAKGGEITELFTAFIMAKLTFSTLRPL